MYIYICIHINQPKIPKNKTFIIEKLKPLKNHLAQAVNRRRPRPPATPATGRPSRQCAAQRIDSHQHTELPWWSSVTVKAAALLVGWVGTGWWATRRNPARIHQGTVGSWIEIYRYLRGFMYPRWCRISSINSIITWSFFNANGLASCW